jgi:hypothetical protein
MDFYAILIINKKNESRITLSRDKLYGWSAIPNQYHTLDRFDPLYCKVQVSG